MHTLLRHVSSYFYVCVRILLMLQVLAVEEIIQVSVKALLRLYWSSIKGLQMLAYYRCWR